MPLQNRVDPWGVLFADLWRRVRGTPEAPLRDLDAALNDDRRLPRAPLGTGKRSYRDRLGDLPDGTMVDRDGDAWLVAADRLLRWSSHGYDRTTPPEPDQPAWVLTPRTTVYVLRAGYRPTLHASADTRADPAPAILRFLVSASRGCGRRSAPPRDHA